MVEQKTSTRAFGFRLSHQKIKFRHLLRPYAFLLFLGCMLLLLTSLIMVALPLLINGGVSLIEQERPFSLNLPFFTVQIVSVYGVLALIIILALVGAVIRTLSRMVLFDVGRTVERDIRQRLFFQITTLDDGFFAKTSVGDLMNHLTTDVANIRMVMGFAALNIMNMLFMFCFTVPLLLKIDVTLAVCALLPFPLVILATSRITKKMFLATIRYQEQLSEVVSHVQENLLGAHVVRLFHQQAQESIRFKVTNLKAYDAGIALARVRVVMLPLMRFMVGIAVLLVLYIGGRGILTGKLSLGDFVEVNARILQLAWPAMSVGFVMSIYSRGKASLERINQLLRYDPVIVDGERNIGPVTQIDVHNLRLNPKDNSEKGSISFSVKQGTMLGVVGPSGSYKTKLLKILYRRQEIPGGMVFFDGKDLNDITLSSIYGQVCVASLETFLFHKTIKENICFLKPNASSNEIDEVIKLVRLDKDFATFKDGIETLVGERGITLSGGQRQRIALARVLLAKRSIVILDDALSAVDADTERHIVVRLKNYLKDSIVIIATHRLSAVRNADHILVLDQGQVVYEGRHDILIKSSSLYQSLWGIDQLKERLL